MALRSINPPSKIINRKKTPEYIKKENKKLSNKITIILEDGLEDSLDAVTAYLVGWLVGFTVYQPFSVHLTPN